MSIMSKAVPHKLDPICFDALRTALQRTGGVVRCADGEMLTAESQMGTLTAAR